jgi:hypothetical protein
MCALAERKNIVHAMSTLELQIRDSGGVEEDRCRGCSSSLAFVRLVNWTLKRHAEKSRESSRVPPNNAAAIHCAA